MSARSFNITVGPKPLQHSFYNKGSKYCYYIDEVPGQLLDLIPDTEYIFNINTPGHPFYFTTSESGLQPGSSERSIGGSEDDNILEGFPPTDKGSVYFVMKKSYPDKFYYQCKIHSYMGYRPSTSVRCHGKLCVKKCQS